MRKICAFLSVILLLAACGKKGNETTVTGEIIGLGNDTIHLFGINDFTDIDTLIYAKENKISFKIKVDTITQALLILPGQRKHPLYLDKKENITIKGDINQPDLLEIKGNQANEELTSFFRQISALPADSIQHKAEEFIRTHQSSLVSVYLLDRFFVQMPEPDTKRIKAFIEMMDGDLQDMRYTSQLSDLVEQAEKVEVSKTTPNFSFTNAAGKKINRYDFRNKYILLNFWASWNDSCKTANAQLRQIYRKYKKEEKLAMIGVSLDVDKQLWRQTIKDDTLAWEQVSDMGGWGSEIVKQFNILNIPFNILIDANGRIIARGIQGEELTNYLEELLKKEKTNK